MSTKIVLVVLSTVTLVHGACLIPSSLKSEKPKLDGKIVGGYEIKITDAPHQVSLQRSSHICGGSIISSKWVLTAAHCTAGKNAEQFKIRLGASETEKGGKVVTVARLVQHEKFNYSSVDYDFSLLELSEEITFSETMKAIALPEADENFMDGDMCRVSGWGNTQNENESRTSLRVAEVPIFNHELCSEKYKKFGGITERMMCAGFVEGGKDACQGDSGGPLVNQGGVLVGVVSWGYGCARPDYPGVYSKVSAAREWIREHSGV